LKKIEVKWMTNKRKEETIDLTDSATVQDLLHELDIDHENYLIVVNGSNRLPDYLLSDGDRIKILHAMAGG